MGDRPAHRSVDRSTTKHLFRAEAAATSAEAAAPSAEASAKEKMQRKLRTATGKDLYAVDKHIVEPVFGMIKSASDPQVAVARPRESVGQWQRC